MPVTKAEWADALAPGIREWFFTGYQNRPTMIPQLFNVLPSDSDSEYFHSFGAISPTAWDDFKNSGRIPQVGFDQGYKTTFTHSTYVVELPVQRELIEDNKYAQLADYAGQLGDSAALKRELDATNVFVNASLATVLGGDGVPLTDASHPLGPNKTGTVQANEGATAFSATAVAAARLAMMAFTDDIGFIAGMVPDTIMVGPTLGDDAILVAQNPTAPGSADNNLNPRQGMKVIINPYLTSATQWFLIDSIKMKQSLIWFDRVPLDIHRKVQDEAIFATWVARMRYSYGYRDWRWIYRGNA